MAELVATFRSTGTVPTRTTGLLGNELLVKLHTTGGLEGFGLATSYTPLDPLVKPWSNGLGDQIIGEDLRLF